MNTINPISSILTRPLVSPAVYVPPQPRIKPTLATSSVSITNQNNVAITVPNGSTEQITKGQNNSYNISITPSSSVAKGVGANRSTSTSFSQISLANGGSAIVTKSAEGSYNVRFLPDLIGQVQRTTA